MLILLEKMVGLCSSWVQAKLVRCCDTLPLGFSLEHSTEVDFDGGVFLFYKMMVSGLETKSPLYFIIVSIKPDIYKGERKFKVSNWKLFVIKHIGTFQKQPERAKVNCLSKFETQTLELNSETSKQCKLSRRCGPYETMLVKCVSNHQPNVSLYFCRAQKKKY